MPHAAPMSPAWQSDGGTAAEGVHTRVYAAWRSCVRKRKRGMHLVSIVPTAAEALRRLAPLIAAVDRGAGQCLNIRRAAAR